MQTFPAVLLSLVLSSAAAYSADHVSVSEMQDKTLSQIEREVVPLAEAMPADKYSFAPTDGAFKGVRTFAQQMSHISAVLNEFSGDLLGEKGVDTGENENGPATLKDKDAIVAYMKDAFVHAHKAVKTLNDQNFTEVMTLSFGKMTRGAMAELLAWHTFDHYGQAVVYARMNNVIPPASRQ